MKFGDIFSDAFKYPTSDYQKLLIFGVFFVLSGLSSILFGFKIYNGMLYSILSVVSLIVGFLILGYSLSVLKLSIDFEDELPDFEWEKNFVDGIKSFVVAFVYFLIPSIIVSILGLISVSAYLPDILNNIVVANNGTASHLVFDAVPKSALTGFFTGLTITAIVAIILFVIFGIFETVAMCRLAKYDSLGEAFSLGQIYDDIKEIGFFKLLGFLIVLYLIIAVISLVIGVVTIIPYAGIIIAFLVGYPFITLFANRSLGLLYSDL